MVQLVLPVVLLLGLQRADSGDIRLVGGAIACDGELQFNHMGKWRDVLVPDFVLCTASVFCQHLECGTVVSADLWVGKSHSAVEMKSHCVYSPPSMRECVLANNVSTILHISITCLDSVRLFYGPSLCSGLLEVNRNQSWTLVCEEDFDLKDAEVVCRELGCGDPSLLQGELYGEGFVPVREIFQCEGHESALMDCPRSSVIQNNCPSGKVVILFCSEPVRVVGESSGCAGTVEIRHSGQWRSVYVAADQHEKVAAEVCHHLGCGAPVSVDFVHFYLQKPVWALLPDCVKNSTYLRECIHSFYDSSTVALKVECSGKLNHLLFLWLIPAVTMIAVIVLIVSKRKKSSMNAQETTERSQPSNTENVELNSASVREDHIYQNMGRDTADQECMELHPQQRFS